MLYIVLNTGIAWDHRVCAFGCSVILLLCY